MNTKKKPTAAIAILSILILQDACVARRKNKDLDAEPSPKSATKQDIGDFKPIPTIEDAAKEIKQAFTEYLADPSANNNALRDAATNVSNMKDGVLLDIIKDKEGYNDLKNDLATADNQATKKDDTYTENDQLTPEEFDEFNEQIKDPYESSYLAGKVLICLGLGLTVASYFPGTYYRFVAGQNKFADIAAYNSLLVYKNTEKIPPGLDQAKFSALIAEAEVKINSNEYKVASNVKAGTKYSRYLGISSLLLGVAAIAAGQYADSYLDLVDSGNKDRLQAGDEASVKLIKKLSHIGQELERLHVSSPG